MAIKTPNYKILHFDLSIARTQEEFNMRGGFVGVKAINGDFFIQLDEKSADPINLRLLPIIRTKFEKIYISNTSQSGGYILFIIGRPCEFDAELGTINPQHANIGFPHQSIPRIKPAPITRPTVLFPPPPAPVKITQITASDTIQYVDNTNHHVTTTSLDIFTSTPLQTPLEGTKKISFCLSSLIGRDIAFEIVLLSSDNIRTLLASIIGSPSDLPRTVVYTLASRGYHVNDRLIISGIPDAVDGSGTNLIVSDFKIMFDI